MCPSVSPRRAMPGHLYVARNETHNFWKIGTARYDIYWRGVELKRVLGAEIVFSLLVDDVGRLEWELHERLAAYRIVVKPYLLPGRREARPVTECYRVELNEIVGALVDIMAECRIRRVRPDLVTADLTPQPSNLRPPFLQKFPADSHEGSAKS
jgi:hypothetical protein